jgi:hypothetical protein
LPFLVGITVFFLPQAFVYQLLILRVGLKVFVSGDIPTIRSIIQRSTVENEGPNNWNLNSGKVKFLQKSLNPSFR